MSSVVYLIHSLTLLLAILSAYAHAQECRLRGLCYAIDQSGSINSAELAEEVNFVSESARVFDRDSATVQTEYSALAFSSGTVPIVTRDTDVQSFITAVNGPRLLGGGTDIFDALDQCFAVLEAGAQGPRVLILVTDGNTQGGTNNAETIKDAGVTIVTVGVGNGVDANLLQSIATAPDLFVAATFRNLSALSGTVAARACEIATDLFPTPSPDVMLPTPSPDVMTPTPSPDVMTPTPSPDVMTPTASPDVITPTPSPDVITPTPSPDVITPTPTPVLLSCSEAFANCEFTFEDATSVQEFDISGTPDVPFTNAIVRKDGLGVGLVNAEAVPAQFIDDSGVAEDITQFGTPSFAPTTFKTYQIGNTLRSGIGRQAIQGDQGVVARGQCVRLFIGAYQIVSEGGMIVGNINVPSGSESECIVFSIAL